MKRRVMVGKEKIKFPEEGLLHYWALNGNAVDSKGGANGSIVGGMSYTNGVLGQCAVFTGGNYITLPIGVNETNWTIQLWISVTRYIGYAGIIFYRTGAYANGLILSDVIYDTEYNGYCVQYYNGGSLRQYLKESGSWTWNQFHHVVFNSQNNIFINGVKSGLSLKYSSGGYQRMYLGNGTCLGFDEVESGRKLRGYMQHVGIWNRILSEEEVQLLYNNGKGVSYN